MKKNKPDERETEIALQQMEEVVAELEAYRDQKIKFEAMSEEELRTYVDDGNALACNILAQKLIMRDGYVDDEALELLERAADDYDLEAASMLGEYYNAKNVGFADREKEIYYRNMSAYGEDKKDNKFIDKIACGKDAAEKEMYRRAENALMCKMLGETLLQVLTSGHTDGLVIEVLPCGEGRKERELFNVSLVFGNGLKIEGGEVGFAEHADREDNVFEYKKRDKKETAAELLNRLKNELRPFAQEVAAELGLKRVVMKSENGADLLYSGSETTAQATAERFGGADFAQAGGKIKLNVTVEEAAGAAERKVCAYCGGPLKAENGALICASCGQKSADETTPASVTDKDNFSVRIREKRADKLAEVLKCTQCGGNVEVAADKGFCTCGHCGSLFAVNEQALSLRRAGLDRAKMDAEKPQDADVPAVEFMLCPFFDGLVQAVLPRSFHLMSAELKAQKYNRTPNPPEFVYTTPDATVNLCFNVDYTKNIADADVPKAEQATRNMLKKMIVGAVFADEAQFANDGHTVAYFDCLTPAADQDVYNLFFFFELSGKLVTGSFNCLAKDRWFWSPVFRLMTESLRFTSAQ